MKLPTIIDTLNQIIFPESCLGCGKRLHTADDDLLCSNCITQIPTTGHYNYDTNEITDLFADNNVPLEYGCTFFNFRKQDWTQNLLHNMKYFNHPRLAKELGKVAAKELVRLGRYSGTEWIVPVPMHDEKVGMRGFNQAEIIAEGLSEVMNLPVCKDSMTKTVNSTTQAFMQWDERVENASKIFISRRVGELCGHHLLLVDDVFTTGSTLIVCSRKLLEAMPDCRISVFALAKT